jgi:hypothetical protein
MKIQIVVAKFKEPIDWLRQLPPDFSIIVYDKSRKNFHWPGRFPIRNLENAGREAHTYLHYMLHDYVPGKFDRIVFTQADPFEHSPDFLKLLDQRSQWRDIQPLTWGYKPLEGIPPQRLLEREVSEFVGDCRVRTEPYSLHSWAPIGHIDAGANEILRIYNEVNGLEPGENIAAHFLNKCGLEDLSHEASGAHIGRFNYGAIFSVTDRILANFVGHRRQQIEQMLEVSKTDRINAWMFERLWLHLMGVPFIRLPGWTA